MLRISEVHSILLFSNILLHKHTVLLLYIKYVKYVNIRSPIDDI